jgi:hypothetical protein
MIYRFNHFGPLYLGALGSNIKDRSAGLVVAYNYLDGGNRQIDIVDSSHSPIYTKPTYQKTYVYGNIFIEYEGTDNRQFIHYGGDSIYPERYRQGTVYVYHNTMISYRFERSTFIRLTNNTASCEARNNIIYVSAPVIKYLQLELLLENRGKVVMKNNWMRDGYVHSFSLSEDDALYSRVENLSPIIRYGNISSYDPGIFVDPFFTYTGNFQIKQSIIPSAPLDSDWPKVTRQYSYHRKSVPRFNNDVGAFGICLNKGKVCRASAECCSKSCSTTLKKCL